MDTVTEPALDVRSHPRLTRIHRIRRYLLSYAPCMPITKRKVSVSLDVDLVEELEASPEDLSTRVNEAVRLDVERKRRQRLLGELLDHLDRRHGPVDEWLVEKYVELLG